VLPASCWQSEPTQKSQIFRQDAGNTLLHRRALIAAKISATTSPLGFTQTGSAQKSDCDKKNIVILDGPEEE
jgi:hypothetical protein